VSMTGAGRTLLLVAGFVCGALAGAWLGLVAAILSGMVVSNHPRFPGEDFVAALAAAVILAVVYVVVRRADGRLSALDLLFVAAYAAFNILCSLYLFLPREFLCFVPGPELPAEAGTNVLLALRQEPVPACRVSTPWFLSPELAAAMFPAALVTVLVCLSEVRRSTLLRSAGLIAGSLFALAGLVLSLVRAFA